MSIRRPRPLSKVRLRQRDQQRELLNKIAQRKMLLEKLEDRHLLAGAQLIGITPTDGSLLELDDLTELNVAPRDLTFRFDNSQQFPQDPEGIRITRAGDDMLLGTADDLLVRPGFLGPNDTPNQNEIVARFAQTLPDDVYRVEIFALDVPSEGVMALRNLNGEAFLSVNEGSDRRTVDFRVNPGAKIISVVPQPVTRNAAGVLEQRNDQILVYLNDDDLFEPTVRNPEFYQLILTGDTARNTDDGGPILPTAVDYDSDLDLVTLTFADDLYKLPGVSGDATFRLRIGTDEAPATPPQVVPDQLGPGSPEVDFQIDLLFPDDTLTPRVQQIIRDAADRWEEIIIGDLPNVGLIDDLEITVVSQFNDGVGHFLGHGFPTNLRPDSFLPFQGKLVLDLYDVINLDALENGAPGTPPGDPAEGLGTISYDAADLTTVVTREIGKVLGFGSLWQRLDLLQNPGSVDPIYVGPTSGSTAIDEYNRLFNVSSFWIPVENTNDAQGAPTPYDEHWREQFFESVLPNELMSGFLSDTDRNFISTITVGAMEDLGYVVDLGAADEYSRRFSIDGSLGESGAAPDDNDDIASATDSDIDRGVNSVYTATDGSIGDSSHAALDVDLIELDLAAGSRLRVDIDAAVNGSPLDSLLRLFDSAGTEIASSDDDAAPGEAVTDDSYLDVTISTGGTYYLGVSGTGNTAYDPSIAGSGVASSTGAYRLNIDVLEKVAPHVDGDELLANPSFETGDLTGWTVSDLASPTFAATVDVAGMTPGGGLFVSQPTNGDFSFLHGFSAAPATAGGTIRLEQLLDIPTGTAELTFDYRAGWTFPGGATLPRMLEVKIEAPGGALLRSETFLTAIAGTANPDTGDRSFRLDLTEFAGSTVRVAVDAVVPEAGGSGFVQIDNLAVRSHFTPMNDAGDSFDTAQDVEVYFETGQSIRVTGDGDTFSDGAMMTVTGPGAATATLTFNETATPPSLNGQLEYVTGTPGPATTADAMAAQIAAEINAAGIGVTATATGDRVTLAADEGVSLGGSVSGVITELVTGSVVIPSSLDPQFYPFDLPGWIDQPGLRTTEYQEHTRGDRRDFTDEIATVYYNFKDHYGFDIQDNPLSNVITETQKTRAREVFELYGSYLGVQFVETDSRGITVATGDIRAVRPTVPTGPGDALGIAGGGVVVLDNSEAADWDDTYGANYFQEMMRQVGLILGLGYNFEGPPGTIMGEVFDPNAVPRIEPVFPGSQDIINGQLLYRPQQKDIDLYSFVIQETGTFVAETFAERLANSSSLDTVLTLYRVVTDKLGNVVLDHNGEPRRELIARNDDYFSEDSLIELDLTPGRYFIGVSSVGNENYNPGIEDSGFGGASEGKYDLRMTFRPQSDSSIEDDTRIALDGDADDNPGGVYNFWFRVAPPLDTTTHTPTDPAVIYVDKSNQPAVGDPAPNGELTNPFNTIPQALSFIAANRAAEPETPFILRLVGNGGEDELLETLDDNIPYELGFRPPFNQPLEDGTSLDVPAGVTVMIDSGVIFKNNQTSINVGSESPSVDRSGGAVQVLGTPFLRDAAGDRILDASGNPVSGAVYFTSWNNEAIGADTNPNAPQTPQPGNWGGLLFRNDQERVEARFDFQNEAIFLNYVNHADISYGGGKVVINSVQQSIDPIHLIEARPTVSFNTITFSAGSAISADPNSFQESNFHDPKTQLEGLYTSDYERVGPEIHDNIVGDNNNNALEIRVDTLAGGEVTRLTTSARFNDTDIVHTLTENLVLQGTPGGSFLETVAPPVELVNHSSPGAVGFTGLLTPGDAYEYVLTFIDNEGNESPPSAVTPAPTDNPPEFLADANGLLQLNDLPPVPFDDDYTGRRIYRRPAGVGDFRLIDQINGSTTVYIDRGQAGTGAVDLSVNSVTGLRRARLDASLVIDPGTVIKVEGSRIEAGLGTTLIAEGVDGQEIIFTSRLDDRFGGSGTFDTNDDADLGAGEAQPGAGNWSGIVLGPVANGSLDHVLLTYAGGIGTIGGSSAAFNPVEIHQSRMVRITNSEFRNNEIGQGGQAGQPDSDRFGQGFNAPSVIFVRGSQPVIVNNIIANNIDTGAIDPDNPIEIAAISINVDAMTADQVFDPGRSTGLVDAFDEYIDNQGPLVRENKLNANGLNSMDVRGGTISTEVVWDDTDIVHTLRDEIIVSNLHTFGGLRLESNATESLVVKLENTGGRQAGFTATGFQTDNTDRIGGMVHIIGQPGHPVVLTSIDDDSVGAGFRPNGRAQFDTRGDDDARAPAPGQWRSVLLDQYSYDNNVDVNVELFEAPDTAAPGINATPSTAQFLGDLAPNVKGGDESRRLGFKVTGFLNDPRDIDVYSFRAEPGTEVWLDIDRTTHSLDTVIELVDSLGQVVARSDDSLYEGLGIDDPVDADLDAEEIFENNPVGADVIEANVLQKSLTEGRDHYTTNSRDAGMRVVLTGTPSPSGIPPTYFVRVRSSSEAISPTNPALFSGKTSGFYDLQIRLQEVDEVAGSTVRFADIRYATTGVEIYGMPAHSPLQGEAIEVYNVNNTADTNDFISSAQSLGNLADQDFGAISVAGQLGIPERPDFVTGDPGFDDVDFYRFDVGLELLQDITDTNTGGEPLTGQDRTFPVTFDIDYADGFSRANTILSVFDSGGALILNGRASNVAEDRPAPLENSDVDDLSRGTIGPLDPFIGPVELPEGTYYVAISSDARIPNVLRQHQVNSPGNANRQTTRVEPITSMRRIVDDDLDTAPAYVTTIRHDDQNPVDVDKFLPASTTQREQVNFLDQPGGTNIADVEVAVLIDEDTSPVPWHLGDVTAYALSGTTISTVNPFTGTTLYTIGTVGRGIADIEIPDRNIRAFSQGGNDGNSGNFLTIDSGTAGVLNLNDDDLTTWNHAGDVVAGEERSPFGASVVGVGYQFEALVELDGGYYAVGNRRDRNRDPLNNGGTPDYIIETGENILYRFDNDGDASGSQRPAGSRHRDAGTNVRERGELRTYTEVTVVGNVVGGGTYTVSIDTPGGVPFHGQAVGVDIGPTLADNEAEADALLAALAADLNANPDFSAVFTAIATKERSADANLQSALEIRFNGPFAAGDGDNYDLRVNDGPATAPLSRSESFGPGGFITGLATEINSTSTNVDLYAVSDQGGLWEVIDRRDTLGADLRFIANILNEDGDRINFGGLDTGPVTEDGRYEGLLFGTGNGRLYAFDPTPEDEGVTMPGQLEPVFFDHEFSVTVPGTDGFAFSTLQDNLWGPAGGLEREQTFDRTRLTAFPATGGFGFTNHDFAGGAHGTTETNTFSLAGYSAADQPMLYFDYNLDTDGGGGTDSFRVFITDDDGSNWSLLTTNDTPDRSLRDAFEIQETYDNTGTWRQVRVPLGDFAGKDNLRLRFDFATAGEMAVGDLDTTGDELRLLPGDRLRDEQTFQVTANNNGDFGYVVQNAEDRFEFDLGYTLVAPSGAKISDGDTFTIDTDGDLSTTGDTVVYEFIDDDLDGVPGNKFGRAAAVAGNVAVPYDARMTPEQVAERMQIAIEETMSNDPANIREFGGVTIDDSSRPLGWDPATQTGVTVMDSNDTFRNAVDTGLKFGTGRYTADATIGDNPNLILTTLGGNLTPLEQHLFPDKGAEDDVDVYMLRINERSTIDATADPDFFFGGFNIALWDDEANLVAGDADFFGAPVSLTYTDDFSRVTRTAPQHSDAPFPRIEDPEWDLAGDPDADEVVVEAGVYFVVVSTGSYDPEVENTGSGTGVVDYDLEIVVSNTDAPVVDPPAAPLAGDELTYGDNRLEGADTPYAFINTHRDGNRVNVPYVGSVTASPLLSGPANSPYARFIEGTPGVFGGDTSNDPNLPILIHSGMTPEQVADATAYALSDVYTGGDRRLVKQYDERVMLIYHELSANDLGQTGNTPGAIATTKLGYTGDFDGQQLPGDAFATQWQHPQRARNNTGGGIRIDNVIVGFAERGEMVINAPSDPTFGQNVYTSPDEVLDGTYQLQIREGAEYAVSIFDTFQPSSQDHAIYRSFGTNDRLGAFVSFEAPSGAEVYEKQTFTLSDGVNTLTFEYDDLDFAQLPGSHPKRVNAGVAAGNVKVGFRDHEPADLIAERIRDAINSPQAQAVLEITAALGDGRAAGTASTSSQVNLFGNAVGSLPTIGSGEYDPYDFGEIEAVVHNVDQQRRTLDTKGSDNDQEQLQHIDYTIRGDENIDRRQGQIVVHSNFISYTDTFGVIVSAGDRDFVAMPDNALSNNPHPGPVANQVVLNTQNLTPGVVVSNNVIFRNNQGGISFTGDSPFGAAQAAPMPYGRIVNNTIFGAAGNPQGTGVLIDDNAAPTVLNNIVAGLQTGIRIGDASSAAATVLSGTLYQDNTNNIGGTLTTLGDFFIDLPTGEPLFVDGAADNFYVAEGSQAIDASVASADDRAFMKSVRGPLGISPSPVIAPERDVTGQLRVDDGTISTPSGQGENTSIDRGAFDRSDTDGPTAQLINPFDNDGFGLDLDPTGTVVFRTDKVFGNFRIQLIDGLSVGSQVDGVGIDDATVADPQVVTVTQDGRFLTESIDYTYTYDPTSDRIQLTPLAGIWPQDATYVITLNNRDRYVVTAVDGGAVVDGQNFEVVDSRGAVTTFEYESGFTLSVPQTLSLQVGSLSGSNVANVSDGNTFEVVNGLVSVVFELNSNGTLNDPVNHVPVDFNASDTVDQVADKIVRAIAGQTQLGLSPSYLGGGRVHVGGTADHDLIVSGAGPSGETHVSNLGRSGSPLAVQDQDTFEISVPGRAPEIFEFDLDGNFTPGRRRIPFRLADPFEKIAQTAADVIAASPLGLTPTYLPGTGSVHLGGVPGTTIDVATNSLLSLGTARPGVTSNLRLEMPLNGGAAIPDSLTFRMNLDGTLRTFEFDSGGGNTSGNQIISFDAMTSQDELADRVVLALGNEGLPATNLGDGVVEIGATVLQLFDSVPALLNPSGVPGGAVPVTFIPSATFFTADQMAVSLLAAFDQAVAEGKLETGVRASLRGGSTLFVEGLEDPATRSNVFSGIGSFYLGGIKDLATNDLKPNQTSEETRFTVLLGDVDLDFGDAPDSSVPVVGGAFRYPTVLADNGARHVVFNNDPLFLGARVDADVDGAPTLASDGDDVEGNGVPFDFSGAPALTSTMAATPLDVQVPETFFLQLPDTGGLNIADGERFTVTNTDSGATETFEFNNFGGLSDGSFVEIPFTTGSTDTGLAADITALLAAAGLGLSPVNLGGGRIHLGSNADHTLAAGMAPSLGSGGAAGSIEDEDTFAVTTSSGVVTFEFDSNFDTQLGNLPVLFDASLTHEQIADRMVRAILDADLGVTPLHDGGGLIGIDGDDEDGVRFLGAFNAFLVTPLVATASGTGLLDAWVDFNADGDFKDPGEKVFNSVRLSEGDNPLSISTPLSANRPTDVSTTARFRFSQLGGLGPDGLAASGEVEDYAITIRKGQPPAAGDDPASGVFFTTEDMAFPPAAPGPSLLDNDTDGDGDPLTVDGAPISGQSSAFGALVDIAADGTFVYDGTSEVDSRSIQALHGGLDLNGDSDFDDAGEYPPETIQDTFTYRATDGFLFSNVATATVTVEGRNDPPRANSQGGFEVQEDGVALVGQLPGDDVDNDDTRSTLNYTVFQSAAGGQVSAVSPGGQFSFNPLPGSDFQTLAMDQLLPITFSYIATDVHGADSGVGTISLNVRGQNDAPTVATVTGTATEDGGATAPIAFLGDDVDDDDDRTTLWYDVVVPATEGAIINADPFDGTFVFDPTGFFNNLAAGDTRTVTAGYTATDQHGAVSFVGTIEIEVTGVNDPPVANDDPSLLGFYDTNEDTPLEITNPANGVLPNDTDPDVGDTLSVVTGAFVTSNNDAAVTLNADGTFTYDPTGAATLQALTEGDVLVDEFTYFVTDGVETSSATVSIVVRGVNDVPIALPVSISAVEDGPAVPIPFAVDDPDGTPPGGQLTFSVVPGSGPSEGRVFRDINGDFFFDPKDIFGDDFQDLGIGQSRQVSFSYVATISNPPQQSVPGVVTVTVDGVNDNPTAVPDVMGINEVNTTLLLRPLDNDFDIDANDALDPASVAATQPTFGTRTVNPDGTILYTPNASFTGEDSFTYTVRDLNGAVSNSAEIRIVTTDFPVAQDDAVTTLESVPVVVNVLGNDSDADGLDPSTVRIVTQPANGTATAEPSGAIRFVSSVIGIETIEYTVKDNVGAESNVAELVVTVIPNTSPYQNPNLNVDVNGDGIVTPFDALLVLTHFQVLGTNLPATPPPPFVDVNGDNIVTPEDIQLVIQFLNVQAQGGQAQPEPLMLPPQDVSLQHSSFATTTYDEPGETLSGDDQLHSSLELLPAADADEGESLLDAIAMENRSRTSDELTDEALVDVLLEG